MATHTTRLSGLRSVDVHWTSAAGARYVLEVQLRQNGSRQFHATIDVDLPGVVYDELGAALIAGLEGGAVSACLEASAAGETEHDRMYRFFRGDGTW
jgi:hypothetical protein